MAGRRENGQHAVVARPKNPEKVWGGAIIGDLLFGRITYGIYPVKPSAILEMTDACPIEIMGA